MENAIYSFLYLAIYIFATRKFFLKYSIKPLFHLVTIACLLEFSQTEYYPLVFYVAIISFITSMVDEKYIFSSIFLMIVGYLLSQLLFILAILIVNQPNPDLFHLGIIFITNAINLILVGLAYIYKDRFYKKNLLNILVPTILSITYFSYLLIVNNII